MTNRCIVIIGTVIFVTTEYLLLFLEEKMPCSAIIKYAYFPSIDPVKKRNACK